ncbi:nucleoside hydrolase [Promicromonospora sp. NPDC059942]|uniref:nucleoside hydrolase n=1 Tax=Promicromonospora sp. NPDC059942 TaxID=3347009 RepID=UPI00365C16E8
MVVARRFSSSVRALASAALALGVAGGAVTPAAAVARPGAADAGGPARPVPVVYDSDLDFDDAATLLYLCQADKRGLIDLRAVTVVNNGVGTPGRSLTHARTILADCGLPDVPVADGSPEWVNEPPPEARELFEQVLSGALGDADVPDVPGPTSAADLIAATVRASRAPVTVLATGPLSNVSAALDRMGPRTLRDRLGRVVVMGGAFDVGGNLFGSTTAGFDNTQEVNMWIDPPAADHVFATVPRARVSIVGLDATNHVPITPAFVDALGAGAETYEARTVHAIVTQPGMPELIGQGVMFWWDALAAVSLVTGEGVDYRVRPVDVVRDGPSSGRTVSVPGGTLQHVGTTADGELFEELFREGLNGTAADDQMARLAR